MSGKCTKVETVAILENDGRYWIGSNWCLTPQRKCPRVARNSPDGQDYYLCKDKCNQLYHAEIEALVKAGPHARGGTMFVIAHRGHCEHCAKAVKEAGVKKVIFGYPPGWGERKN